jgi:hypothetical protein
MWGINSWVGNQTVLLTRHGQCCMGQRLAVAYSKALPTLTGQTFSVSAAALASATALGLSQFQSANDSWQGAYGPVLTVDAYAPDA